MCQPGKQRLAFFAALFYFWFLISLLVQDHYSENKGSGPNKNVKLSDKLNSYGMESLIFPLPRYTLWAYPIAMAAAKEVRPAIFIFWAPDLLFLHDPTIFHGLLID